MMNELEIGNLISLRWLWVIGLTAIILAFGLYWQFIAARRFATGPRVADILPNHVAKRFWIAGGLRLVALVLLVIAAIDLRWGLIQRQVPQKGIEVMFVLDISRSMLADDVRPNRLQRAKEMIRDMIEPMSSDRVGLIVFAGRIRTLVPLTSHYADFLQKLEQADPFSVPKGGSRIGDAIGLARRRFLSDRNDHKVIVLLSDGEDHSSNPLAAAGSLADSGIRMIVIGIGDPNEGSLIPLRDGQSETSLMYEGEPVRTKLNSETLRSLAQASGGIYVPAETKRVSMGQLYQRCLAEVARREYQRANISSYEARFQWFLVPALIAMVTEVIVMTGHWPKGSKGR